MKLDLRLHLVILLTNSLIPYIFAAVGGVEDYVEIVEESEVVPAAPAAALAQVASIAPQPVLLAAAPPPPVAQPASLLPAQPQGPPPEAVVIKDEFAGTVGEGWELRKKFLDQALALVERTNQMLDEIEKFVHQREIEHRALDLELDNFYQMVGDKIGRLAAIRDRIQRYLDRKNAVLAIQPATTAAPAFITARQNMQALVSKTMTEVAQLKLDIDQARQLFGQVDVEEDAVRNNIRVMNEKLSEVRRLSEEASKAKGDIPYVARDADAQQKVTAITTHVGQIDAIKMEMTGRIAQEFQQMLANVRTKIGDVTQRANNAEQRITQIQSIVDQIGKLEEAAAAQDERALVKQIATMPSGGTKGASTTIAKSGLYGQAVDVARTVALGAVGGVRVMATATAAIVSGVASYANKFFAAKTPSLPAVAQQPTPPSASAQPVNLQPSAPAAASVQSVLQPPVSAQPTPVASPVMTAPPPPTPSPVPPVGAPASQQSPAALGMPGPR